MKRGEIWTVAAGSGYAGKPRPAVIVQDDRFITDSITICGLTSNSTDTPILRPAVEPSESNGLTATSWLMVDKIVTVPRVKLRRRIGVLSEGDIGHLNRAAVIFLGLAG